MVSPCLLKGIHHFEKLPCEQSDADWTTVVSFAKMRRELRFPSRRPTQVGGHPNPPQTQTPQTPPHGFPNRAEVFARNVRSQASHRRRPRRCCSRRRLGATAVAPGGERLIAHVFAQKTDGRGSKEHPHQKNNTDFSPGFDLQGSILGTYF